MVSPFFTTCPILLLLKADTLPELLTELSLTPDWRNKFSQTHVMAWLSSDVTSRRNSRREGYTRKCFTPNWYICHLGGGKWHRLMQNDCWHHCTVSKKWKVRRADFITWGLQRACLPEKKRVKIRWYTGTQLNVDANNEENKGTKCRGYMEGTQVETGRYSTLKEGIRK